MSFGTETVSVTTTAARISTSDYIRSSRKCTLYASPANTGTIYVGRSDVTTSNGFPLRAGEAVEVPAEDVAVIYAAGSTGTQTLLLGFDSSLIAAVRQNAANLVSLADAGSFTAADDVEEALAEIYQDLKSTKGFINIPLTGAILAAGTPMAAFADNAGASAPGITLANSKVVGLRWNNNESQTAVWLGSIPIPADFDITADAVLNVLASKTGATSGDATTFTIAAFNNASGALHDADSDFGGATSAMTGNATAKTIQKVTRTLALADLASNPNAISMSIKPTDGTLGTDDVIVHAVYLEYKRKLRVA